MSRQRDGLDEAMAWYRKARRLLARVGDDEGLRVVYSRLGDLYARLPGKTRRAAACYRLAISRWERARELLTGDMLRLSFLGRGLDPYHGLLALYIREGHKTAAFIAAEQARARSLVEAVTRIVGLPGGATLDAPPPETRADQAAYAELRDPPPTTVASLRAFLAATEDELAQLPRPGDYRSTPRRAILASYAVSPGAIHLFVLRSDMEEPELFSEPLDDNLRRFVRTNFGSARRVSSLLHGSSVRLWYDYNWLIAPLATYAAPGDLIYLAPSGILRDVPLHTLHLAGMPLGLRNTVVYVPAAGLLTACRARRCTAPDGAPLRARVAVFGDAQNNLAHARDEAETLARMFGIAPVLGAAVTAETIGEALQSCDLVHISGHGAFGGTDAGEQTALLLANGQVFSAQDVLALPPLPTQLVTLGGCETGVSDERPGDEQIGLHRALLIAGVRAMLLSLWSVGDPSAAFLMKQLYRYLGASEGWCLADALHLAMHDTSKQKDWSAFYHWAPFVLIGDWR
ncbi:MAG: CHAT domain-containing protein [Chloroflexaceae bacterium]|nr:CHAT domain-containing protein [Chloroflexaceae bacterium]